MGFTIPEDVLGVPLYVPQQHNYFEIEDGGMPNGDACLVIRGDLSTDYKAFMRAPIMTPSDICNLGDLTLQDEWAMSCWFKLSNLTGTPVDSAMMLGCSGYSSSAPASWTADRNPGFPFALMATNTVNTVRWAREPLNNIASPASSKTMIMTPSFQLFQDYWFLVVINITVVPLTSVTSSIFMDTYNNALTSDSAGGSAPGGSYSGVPRYLHIGAYHNGGVGRADVWRMGKWAFHDHALTIAERLAMWQAMMGTDHLHTDDFNRASLGVNWQSMFSSFTIDTNRAFATSASSTDRNMIWTQDLGTPNMYAEVLNISNGYWTMPMVRCGSYGANTYYKGGYSNFNNRWEINRSGTAIATSVAAAPSYPVTLRLEAVTDGSGNVGLSLYADGVLKLSHTDSDAGRILTASNAGLALKARTTSPLDAIADDFVCATIAA